jgi:hypothetical protein
MASGIDDLLGTTPPTQRNTNLSADRTDTQTVKLFTRYKDAYRVADIVVGVGSTLKRIGYVLGGIVVLLAYWGISGSNGSGFGFEAALVITGLIAGFFLAALFYILGTLISAVGQMHRATIDTAVNTSPHLSNVDRAIIMGIT